MCEYDEDRPSRSAKRRAAKVHEVLAHELAEMQDNRLSLIELPQILREEILIARQTKGHNSRKRQIKYLAGVFRREHEAYEELLASYNDINRMHYQAQADFHHLEVLRDRLCNKDSFADAMAEIESRLPKAAQAALTRLAKSAHQSQDKRAARELFKRLRELFGDNSKAE